MSSFYADSVVSRKYDDSQMFTLDKFNRLERNTGEISDRYFFFPCHYEMHRGKGHIFRGKRCFRGFQTVREHLFSHPDPETEKCDVA